MTKCRGFSVLVRYIFGKILSLLRPPCHYHRIESEQSKHQGMDQHTTLSRDVYLTPDERYQLWLVKAAERPQLLHVLIDADDDEVGHTKEVDVLVLVSSDEKKEDASNEQQDFTVFNSNEHTHIMPLQDGCDIVGWRCQSIGMAKCVTTSGTCTTASSQHDDDDDERLALLRVGPGCTLTRLESQLPLPKPSSTWLELQQRLLQPPAFSNVVPRRIHGHDRGSSATRRRLNLERDAVPVVVEGCCDDWPAMQSCRFAALVERFGHVEWRFSDTHGETLTLQTYQKYCRSMEGCTDDAPLAVYDSQFGNDERAVIAQEYSVPSCFGDDLFDQVIPDERERPPYRWILTGPERSGTGLHVDPVGTHAWVSLLEGCKRWVLFPPSTCRQTIHMMDDNNNNNNNEEPQLPSVQWFLRHYDAVLSSPCSAGGADGVAGAVEILQMPGETVYVPAGWPHLVLNVAPGMTTAITHNYATTFPSLSLLMQEIKAAEPILAERFRTGLQQRRPELYEQLVEEDEYQKVQQHQNETV
jgi:histone arginine demethylase JMJD6